MSAKSGRPSELDTNMEMDGVSYRVQTVDLGREQAKVVTRVFAGDKVVKTEEAGYVRLLRYGDLGERVEALMRERHRAVKDAFVAECRKKGGKKSEYFKKVNAYLRKGEGGKAHLVLESALDAYPGDPVLLSYYGCLTAMVNNDPGKGIRLCKQALKMLRESFPFGGDRFYPVFYLNLGRAYLAGGEKQEAITIFKRGLRVDPKSKDLLAELRKLGTRKPPPVAFLDRENPINKHIGLLLRKNVKAGKPG